MRRLACELVVQPTSVYFSGGRLACELVAQSTSAVLVAVPGGASRRETFKKALGGIAIAPGVLI